MEYLEEIYPSPTMLGETPEQRAQTRATDRVASEIFTVLAQMLMHTEPAALQFHPGLVQHRQVGEALQPLIDQLLDQLESASVTRVSWRARVPQSPIAHSLR